jgi:hypothetical protein
VKTLASVYLVARFVSRLIPAVIGIRHLGIPRLNSGGKEWLEFSLASADARFGVSQGHQVVAWPQGKQTFKRGQPEPCGVRVIFTNGDNHMIRRARMENEPSLRSPKAQKPKAERGPALFVIQWMTTSRFSSHTKTTGRLTVHSWQAQP